MKKKLLWGIVLIVAASGVFAYNFVRLNHSVAVELTEAAQGELSENIYASGKLESGSIADQLVETSGKVADVKVEKGDRVQKGQLLVVMDMSDIEQQLALEQNKLKQIELEREKARKTDFEAKRQAILQGGDPEEDNNALAAFDLQIQGAQINLAALSEKLAHKQLLAAQDGIVTELSVKPGQLVQQGMPALQVTDVDHLRVRAYLSELDANHAQEKMAAIISGDAFANTYNGKLTYIASVAAPIDQTSKDPAVEILVSVDQPQQELKPGFNASIELVVKQPPKLLIPLKSVQNIGDKSYVYQIKDGRSARVEVKLGAENDEKVQVLAGLRENDEIIADVQDDMREGKKVKVK